MASALPKLPEWLKWSPVVDAAVCQLCSALIPVATLERDPAVLTNPSAHACSYGAGAVRVMLQPSETVLSRREIPDLSVDPGMQSSDLGASVRFPTREGPNVIIGKTPLAGALTDADLRAECERRGMYVGPQHIPAGRTPLENRLIEERDEWKRRAEAAEAIAVRHGPRDYTPGGCAVCGAPPNAPCTASCNDDRVPDARVRRFAESGPSIGSHPPDIHKPDADNAQWGCTLEDLLAGDA